MQMTEHAQRRWTERFAHLDLAQEFARARRLSKRQRKLLRAQIPWRERDICGQGGFCGRYYLVSPNQVVFVVAPHEEVVTVFRLTGSPFWQCTESPEVRC
jgi:hypothetical protein